MYNVDWDKFIDNMLPWFLRKEVLKSYLKALLSPLITLYTEVVDYINDRRWIAQLSGQVLPLEIMLNTIFYNDPDLTLIYITDNDVPESVYLYNAAELIEPTYLYNASETSDPVYVFNSYDPPEPDFTVNVPDNLVFDTNYMISLINRHKIAGPTYNIELYTL